MSWSSTTTPTRRRSRGPFRTRRLRRAGDATGEGRTGGGRLTVDRLGTFALLVALALALYGLVGSVIGARTGRPLLVESARTTAFSLFALVAAANGAMLAAILSNDFGIA